MTEESPSPGDGEGKKEQDLERTPRASNTQPEAAVVSTPSRAQAASGEHGDGATEGNDSTEEETDDDGYDDEEEEDEEPRLRYARLTPHLGAVYRNGDATSSFLVSGDKMVIGTHNGNIHVIQLPLFQSLRVYHAHAASVTSVSISPCPLPLPKLKPEVAARVVSQAASSPLRPASVTSETKSSTAAAAAQRKPKEPPGVPQTPSNNIHIATSSMDGNVCVQSLVDVKDVSLRNFARPVLAVALSPDYKNDRTYLSGGRAEQLVLTVGAPQGRSTSTTTGTAAAAAGWLGSVGLGTNTGRDTILHSGEGAISSIKWSLSGKYVAFLNEHGVWILRTGLHLDKMETEDSWTRVEHGHVNRPQTGEWETMASVWKGTLEWIDEDAVENEEEPAKPAIAGSTATETLKQQHIKANKKTERLLIGWGGIIWLVNVSPASIGTGRNVGEKFRASAQVVKKLRLDCLISGVSLYTQSLLLVLAYCLPEDDVEKSGQGKQKERQAEKQQQASSHKREPSGGVPRRQNNQRPELRLIDLKTETETTMESLNISRFERLNASDYHLGVLPAQNVASSVATTRGALEALAGFGSDMWNVAINPKSLFSSAASGKSGDSNDGESTGSKAGSTAGSSSSTRRTGMVTLHPNLLKPGIKIFMHSPYDCILATKRDLADHLGWLVERKQYQEAWELVDEHPEIMVNAEKPSETSQSTLVKTQISDDFYEDTSSVAEGTRGAYNSAEREKRRIGELWVQELIAEDNWTRAGLVCGKVVTSADRWEKWITTFSEADKYDDIAYQVPSRPLQPPISRRVYDDMLEHYIKTDLPRFRDLLDRWPTELFSLRSISTTLENLLKFRDVREDSVEDGETGRDWRIVMESLARLHEANGRNREALRCYIRLQDADSAMRLIKDSHLADAVTDDIPGFFALRVPQTGADHMTLAQLERATSEAVTLLVDEAQHGLVKPAVVVEQLRAKGLNHYTFFYLRGLWSGEGIKEHTNEFRDRLVSDSKSLVDEFADLVVQLFAVYEPALLMGFLKSSTAYTIEKAVQECESHKYIPELVYLYSKMGQNRRALYLIIDRLRDVSQAISFAKAQDDPDLWEDLLKYSMDKPRFIRGLLEEVGTSIDPIALVRRIPEGLEIPGLREGLSHIMREHEIQHSISNGVARVLRSEVSAAQAALRAGQRKGVKFEIVIKAADHVDVKAKDVITAEPDDESDDDDGKSTASAGTSGALTEGTPAPSQKPRKQKRQQKGPRAPAKKWQPGHCPVCFEPFEVWEPETLIGFTCGHVFHAAHLMQLLHPDEPPGVDFLLGSTDLENEDHGGSYSSGARVGPKVTRARLLRDRVGGCPVCAKKAKEVSL